MNNYINIGGVQIELNTLLIVAGIIIIALVIAVVSLIMIFRRLYKNYNIFMRGERGKSLEEEMLKLFKDTEIMEEMIRNNKKRINELFRKQENNYQKLGIVKYDAFEQMGGKISFALCLMNERNEGIVINSVHGMDGCYNYAKPLVNASCDIELSKEEKKAIEMALGELGGKL